ncbi:MAG: ParB/RepB/Spo0J family partition protein [Pirellulales bacterium]|nr:ParB/RepB/Spo0J family partition protein [Pirellulales bacterium]
MSTAPRRLGRGLEALLGHTAVATVPQPQLHLHQPDADAPAVAELPRVGVYEIDRNPYQPRKDFAEEHIAELADSLDRHGLLQPLVVRRVGERYQLIAGERRLRAAIKAGWPDVPVQIRDIDDRQMSELAMVENLQRKDLNALEKAASFAAYLRDYRCTQEELAQRLACDRSTVANLIRLLELPATVQQALRSGALSAGHARALLPLGDEREQIRHCQLIQAEGWSVRLTEQRVQEFLDGEDAAAPQDQARDIIPSATAKNKHKPARTRTSQLVSLEQELRQALGTKIDIRQSARGKGKIVIHFGSADEFERLREYLVGVED